MSIMSWEMYPKIKTVVRQFDKKKAIKEIIDKYDDFIPYRKGRSYSGSALSTNIINVRPKHYFIDFNEESRLLNIQAGALLSDIQEFFLPRGWFLEISHRTKFIAVGGTLASDLLGKNYHVEGCFSE